MKDILLIFFKVRALSPSYAGSYDWLRLGQLRPIGNVFCDLILQSHAVVYSLLLVIGHMLICMIIYVFIFIPSGQ